MNVYGKPSMWTYIRVSVYSVLQSKHACVVIALCMHMCMCSVSLNFLRDKDKQFHYIASLS